MAEVNWSVARGRRQLHARLCQVNASVACGRNFHQAGRLRNLDDRHPRAHRVGQAECVDDQRGIGGFGAERDKQHLIVVSIDDFRECGPRLGEAQVVERAFEYRKLEPGAVAFEGFGHTPQALRVRDVVTHEIASARRGHGLRCLSAGGEAVIGGRIAADDAPELAGLNFEHAPVAHLVAEFGVFDLSVDPAKPPLPETTSSLFVQEGARRGADKIAGVDLPAVDERDRDRVRDERAKLFHQVECEGGTSVAWLVHEAEKRVQANGVADAGEFLGENGVAEREQCVDGIARRAAVAAGEVELPFGAFEHRRELFEVEVGGGAFDAEQFGEVARVFGRIACLGEQTQHAVGNVAVAHEHRALVGDFCADGFTGEFEAKKRLGKQARLAEAGVDTAGGQSAQESEEAAGCSEVGNVDAMFEAGFGGLGGELDCSVKIDRAHLMQWELADDFALHGDDELAAALADLRPGFLDNEEFTVVARRTRRWNRIVIGGRFAGELERKFSRWKRKAKLGILGGCAFAGVRPPRAFARKANGVGGAVVAAAVVDERGRKFACGGDSARFGECRARFSEEFVGESNRHTAFFFGVVNFGGGYGGPVFAQQERVGGHLHGIVFLREACAIVEPAGGPFLVIDDAGADGIAFDHIDDADEIEFGAFETERANTCAFGQTLAKRGGAFFVETGRLIGVAVGGGAGGGVGVFLEDVFDPLEIEKPWAVEVVVQPAHGHRRLGGEVARRGERRVGHGEQLVGRLVEAHSPAVGGRIGCDELADRFEEIADGFVVAFEAALEFGEFAGKLAVTGEQLAELNEGTNDRDAHGDGARAAEDAGEHGDALFGEDAGRLATAAARFWSIFKSLQSRGLTA